MALNNFWVSLILCLGFWAACFCDQDGFLSLSCGGAVSYFDPSNISWIPDSSYISTGNSSTVYYIDGVSSSNVPIRFFPDTEDRECYKLPVKNVSSLVLVRAQFTYKNYDSLGKPPAFSVSLGTALACTVNLTIKDTWTEEFVWLASKEAVSFCLHSIPDGGSPVISTLEVRPLPQGAYQNGMEDFPDKLLRKSYRINSGDTSGLLRYPLDPFDRIWEADQSYAPFRMSSEFHSLLGFNLSSLRESPPVAVLQTARIVARKNVLTYELPLDTMGDYYIILYFAGVLPVSPSFNVFVNGNLKQSEYMVPISGASNLYITQKGITSLNITLEGTKFFPQINALEVYQIVDIPPEASSTTVSALQVIQQSVGLNLGWEDDPCSPFPWDRIGCDGSSVISLDLANINLRSISPTFGDLLDLKILKLQNTSLAGAIQNLGSLQHLENLNLSFNQLTSFGSDLTDLVSLQVLDLQNNSLKGMVPESLGELQNLHLLNLENNKLQGTLPQSLNRESLEVRASGNLCLSFSTMSCTDASSDPSIETPQATIDPKRKHSGQSHLASVVGGVAGALFAITLISLLVVLYIRKRKYEDAHTLRAALYMRNWNAARVFSYREIKAATHNFKEVIGRGSFGTVYHGKLPDGKLVAVKVRFDRTQLGAESFINEVHLLSKIRHQNLVYLEGFCHESKQQILVYEYLPGGSLADHLYGPNSLKVSLSWVRRLKIAIDAAKGLDYLHNGSNPRIIHRDVKCSNILLDEQMNAKLSDFGLSKQMVQANATHITTVVNGTAGYLDPEYYSTQQLTEKSDIYSFGVVLLELICGREPLTHAGTPDSFNLVLWAKPYLQAGAFDVVDESLRGSFGVESIRVASLVAIWSVDRDATQRPKIAEVLAELKEAYSIQLSYLASLGHS